MKNKISGWRALVLLPFIFSLILSGAAATFLYVQTAHAQSGQTPNSTPTFPFWAPNGLLSCTGYYCPNEIGGAPTLGPGAVTCNSFCDLIQTGQNVLYFGLTIAVFILVPVMIIWGAVTMMLAAGSPERVKSGRAIITNTVIGLLICIGAFVIVNTFFWGLGQISGGSTPNWGQIACVPANLPGTLPANYGANCPTLTVPAATTPTNSNTSNGSSQAPPGAATTCGSGCPAGQVCEASPITGTYYCGTGGN